MDERDIEATQKRYRERWEKFGYDPRTLGWNKGRQRARFAAALDGVRERFDSILDVGCGFGDLFGFLHQRGWQGRYVGVDIVPELLEEGTRRFGALGAEFQFGDFSRQSGQVTTDVAIAIGMFNHVLGNDNAAFIRETLGSMWKATRKVIVADFMSTAAEIRHPHLFYFSPEDAAGLARTFSRRFLINHGYMPFEFQLVVWHDEAFSADAPVFRPYRELV